MGMGMGMTKLIAILFFALTLAASDAGAIPNQIHPLRPQTGSAGRRDPSLNCLSWRFAVETDSIQNWKVVPGECESYVGHYMLGKQYREDSEEVAAAAYDYAKNLTLGKDGKDIWVFDIDETSLSNLPYYARPATAFGAIPYNNTAFSIWEEEGKAPALPPTLGLYKKLLKLGFKVAFITGRAESFKNITIDNLHKVGYATWEKLVLKSAEVTAKGLTAMEYKSGERTKLVKAGYRILGNMGDEWSDIMGANAGKRTFKLPNPMYYIA